MVKFRCPRCGQKIEVIDEGIGAVIDCSTCRERLVVPPRTAAEFVPAISVDPVLEVVVEPPGTDRIPETDRARALVRAGLLPHLARLMMNGLVQTLWCQRQSLFETQQAATAQVEALEQRLARIQTQFQSLLLTHQKRIAELEKKLAAREWENRELTRENSELIQRTARRESAATSRPVDLSDAGFLLRA